MVFDLGTTVNPEKNIWLDLLERWPKDGYEALRKDNFQRRQGGGNYHNDRRRNQGFGEEYMEHRRKQREEICERGAHEVWGRSPSREELVYNSSEDEKVSNDSSSEKDKKVSKKSKKSHKHKKSKKSTCLGSITGCMEQIKDVTLKHVRKRNPVI